jgi:hypothetical protein
MPLIDLVRRGPVLVVHTGPVGVVVGFAVGVVLVPRRVLRVLWVLVARVLTGVTTVRVATVGFAPWPFGSIRTWPVRRRALGTVSAGSLARPWPTGSVSTGAVAAGTVAGSMAGAARTVAAGRVRARASGRARVAARHRTAGVRCVRVRAHGSTRAGSARAAGVLAARPTGSPSARTLAAGPMACRTVAARPGRSGAVWAWPALRRWARGSGACRSVRALRSWATGVRWSAVGGCARRTEAVGASARRVRGTGGTGWARWSAAGAGVGWSATPRPAWPVRSPVATGRLRCSWRRRCRAARRTGPATAGTTTRRTTTSTTGVAATGTAGGHTAHAATHRLALLRPARLATTTRVVPVRRAWRSRRTSGCVRPRRRGRAT